MKNQNISNNKRKTVKELRALMYENSIVWDWTERQGLRFWAEEYNNNADNMEKLFTEIKNKQKDDKIIRDEKAYSKIKVLDIIEENNSKYNTYENIKSKAELLRFIEDSRDEIQGKYKESHLKLLRLAIKGLSMNKRDWTLDQGIRFWRLQYQLNKKNTKLVFAYMMEKGAHSEEKIEEIVKTTADIGAFRELMNITTISINRKHGKRR